MELLAQGINVWIDDDLAFKKDALLPIEYFEEAFKKAVDSEKQELCDEISSLYENLQLHIITQTIYYTFLGGGFKNYYFDLQTAFNRHKRMKCFEETANENGQSLKLIEWSSLLKLIINTCIMECIERLPVKNEFNLFDDDNCFDFIDVEQIERFSNLLYRLKVLVPVLDHQCKMFSSLDNYELFFKRFYSFGKLLRRLSKNTCADLTAKHSIDRLINGIYTAPIDNTISAIKSISYHADSFMSPIAFKKLNKDLKNAIDVSYEYWAAERKEFSNQVEALKDELQEVSQKYQSQIDMLYKKKQSIFSIFTSKDTKQNLIDDIAKLENEKATRTKDLNKKYSDAEKNYKAAREICYMFHVARINPLREEVDWEMILENMKVQGEYHNIPTRKFSSKGDLVEFL